MSELDRETLRLLEIGREARTPSAADRARVRQRLATAAGIALVEPVAEAWATPPATATATATAAVADGWPAPATTAAVTLDGPREAAVNGAKARRAGGARLVFGSAAAAWILGGVCAASAMVGGLLVVVTVSRPAPAPVEQHAPRNATALTARVKAAPKHVEPTAAVDVAAPIVPAVPEVSDREAATAPLGERHRPRSAARAGDPLIAELQLLHRARSAWQNGDAAGALGLLNQHRARYGASTVAVERDALRVLCLCDLGRDAEATRLGKRWLRGAEQSPLRGAVTQSCVFE